MLLILGHEHLIWEKSELVIKLSNGISLNLVPDNQHQNCLRGEERGRHGAWNGGSVSKS